MQRNYLVYKHTSPSGKMYIGLTDNYSRRSKQHQCTAARGEGYAFHAAIRKYGWNAFKHEIVVDSLTKQQAERLEVVLIKELNTYAPNGYNLTLGGDGIDSESVRRSKIANRREDVKGYHWRGDIQKYSVKLGYLGKSLSFSYHELEEEAASRANFLMSLADEELLKAYEECKIGKNKGYYFNKKAGTYQVQLMKGSKRKGYGSYLTEEEAAERVAQVRNEFNA